MSGQEVCMCETCRSSENSTCTGTISTRYGYACKQYSLLCSFPTVITTIIMIAMVRYNHILSSHVRCGHGDNEGDDGDEAGIFLEQKSKFRGLREMVLRQSGDS